MTDSELQQKRLIAAAIDVGVGMAVVLIVVGGMFVVSIGMVAATRGSMLAMYVPRLVGFAGSLVVLGYVLGRDVLVGGRSIGKKIQDIRVTAGGQPIGAVDSAKRNAIFAAGAALWVLSATFHLIPCLGTVVGCLVTPLLFLAGLATMAVAVIEVIKITQDPEGVRLGDQFANTRVVR
jgi:hypothetical protein